MVVVVEEVEVVVDEVLELEVLLVEVVVVVVVSLLELLPQLEMDINKKGASKANNRPVFIVFFIWFWILLFFFTGHI